ncbi:sigma-70 family RNA polymerase sigma factor (plasmid) [Streptomyces sp. NBC_01298]|uniref:RNA polymerase sigma factor n=1 Tax=Streptomyces sp. NBC_01298 TaxID=2903817 RepID=UPI002E12DC4C|nr:sigma-70 family RNA polymerase sigma factor [Streptomyces sp. NBC_01298]
MNNDPFGQERDLVEPEPERASFPIDFDVFLRNYKDSFFRIANGRLRDPRDADEALQDAAMIMYRKWERILAHPKPIKLAHKILDNSITDFYRRNARRGDREQSLTELPDTTHLIHLRSGDRLDRALEALRQLAPLTASCWEMHHRDELPYSEIGERLGISEGAAKTNASRGKTKLQALLTELPDTEKGDS